MRITRSVKTTFLNPNLSRQFHNQSQQLIRQLQGAKDLKFVLLSHTKLLTSGFLIETFPNNHLINGYIRCRDIRNAHKVFDEMPERNTVSWTLLMGGYSAAGDPKMALELFSRMLQDMVLPNEFTLSTVINACSAIGDVKAGEMVHGCSEIYGCRRNLVVCTVLIDMYGKVNDLVAARRVFDLMVERNVVSWTSMIAGYARNAQGYEALEVFREFNQVEDDPPNQFMLSSVVNACASMGRLVYGKIIHGVVVKRGHESNEVVACALEDMYAKCGCIDFSLKLFRSMQNPSLISYTSMIISSAKHGLGELSISLFEEMICNRIKPSDVTFLGVLYACSHSGLVDQGFDLLNSMRVHGVVPDVRHYSCVVDMLGRRGRLDEAYEIAKTIQIPQDREGALLWGALLSASRLHGRVDIATEASYWLMEAKQQVNSVYVSMSNTLALSGNWDDAQAIRSAMKRAGVRKEPGRSWVEIKDSIYTFYARDIESCPRSEEVLRLLADLETRMKERGFVSSREVYVDVEEESKEELMSLHSERLALGFCLITVPREETIRIMKNLRMCGDCHEVFKLISSIVDRDFVVRDCNRFHHFRNGSCSCRDYW